MSASRPMEAARILESIAPSDGDYFAAQTLLGYLFLQRSELGRAESTFRTVLSGQKENVSARLGLGMALVRGGSADRAAGEFKKILADPSLGLEAQIQWIQSLFLSGQTDEAFWAARQLASDHNAVAAAHSLLGFFYQVRSETGEALREYLLCAQLDLGDLPAHFSLISLYGKQGDWESALRWAKRALTLDANHPLLYKDLATIYDKLGQTAKAAEARRAEERTFKAELLYARALRAARAGRQRDAEAGLRASTGLNPGLSKAWTELGELLRGEHRLPEAREAFLRALDTEPGDSRAVAGLTLTLREEGRETEALRFAREAVRSGTPSPDVLTAMAALYRDQGKAQDAESAVRRALRTLPDDPDLLAYLGYLQQSGGQVREALESYAAALLLNPRLVDALTGQGQSLLLQGNTTGALASLGLARSLEPKNTGILKALVEAYIKSDNAHSAEATCRECLDIAPDDSELPRAAGGAETECL